MSIVFPHVGVFCPVGLAVLVADFESFFGVFSSRSSDDMTRLDLVERHVLVD